MTRLLVVRHGETEWNRDRRYQGQKNVGLNDTGQRQAERLKDRLADENIVAAYSSDLQRAKRTAETIVSSKGLEVVPFPGLRELDFGQFEGLTFEEIEQRFPSENRSWLSRRIDVSPPGGENLVQLAKRVSSATDRILRQNAEGTVLVASHGGPIRAILCSLLEIGLTFWWRFRIGTGSLTIVETYPEGAVLTLLNETSFHDSGKDNVWWPSP
ncbi:MAG: alpha-ribazole phosphatase [Chloroflexota bacterium]